ncbi:MAG TPA: class I SAM-dependent methyltransferase [Rhizomicrobium sp.]|nr:class I SAM-dependent methyltransferase [Rhizomicrobium sp.]
MSTAGEDARTSADRAKAVRAFYESHPYPAPIDSLEGRLDRYRSPGRRRAQSLLLWPLEKPRADRTILVAGCGTSQAARYALMEPEARVTAIDISEASLLHTRNLQHKHDIRNLQLHRLAIEQIGELGETFDQIVCTGVLHHLSDPDAGLKSLRDVLTPDGAMHIMVYAPYGRAGIYMMQDYCRLLGIGVRDEDLRDLGETVQALPIDHPIAGVVKRAKDFARPNALVDALLNPQDRAYSVPQIYEWLERCGLKFGRWHEQAPYLPQCGAIDGAPHAARLAALPPRAQYAAIELLRGTMDKHSFVAYRDDREREAQPITFDGDGWRSFVPVRLPWTLTVKDRAPRGVSAVLINPSHTYPDLALFIDAAQERVLRAIDGERSVAEILRGAGETIGNENGRQFFKRLWEHDLIVFDAKRPP